MSVSQDPMELDGFGCHRIRYLDAEHLATVLSAVRDRLDSALAF